MNKCMHKNQDVGRGQSLNSLPPAYQPRHMNIMISSEDSGDHSRDSEMNSEGSEPSLNTIRERESVSAPLHIRNVKISVPKDNQSVRNAEMIPDFSCLPDIPKLSVRLTIDELTSVPSQTNNLESPKVDESTIKRYMRQFRWSGLDRLDTEASYKTEGSLDSAKSNKSNSNVITKSSSNGYKTEVFCGKKRKAQINLDRPQHFAQSTGYQSSGFDCFRRRDEKCERKGLENEVTNIPRLSLKRSNTLASLLRKKLDNELSCDNECLRMVKRPRSVPKVSFQDRPSPPLNTTRYIILSQGNNNFELPRFGYKSPQKHICLGEVNGENTPDTCDSMEGLVTEDLFS